MNIVRSLVYCCIIACAGFCPDLAGQTKILIPMDLKQTDHLKSYGVAFWVLQHNGEVDWLLNYRGGSFLCDFSDVLARECRIRGVSSESIGGSAAATIYAADGRYR